MYSQEQIASHNAAINNEYPKDIASMNDKLLANPDPRVQLFALQVKYIQENNSQMPRSELNRLRKELLKT